jgi:hypothetical protein
LTSKGKLLLYAPISRRDGRAVECTGLENRHRLIAYPGFESLSLRHNMKGISYLAGFLFSFLGTKKGESITRGTPAVILLQPDQCIID